MVEFHSSTFMATPFFCSSCYFASQVFGGFFRGHQISFTQSGHVQQVEKAGDQSLRCHLIINAEIIFVDFLIMYMYRKVPTFKYFNLTQHTNTITQGLCVQFYPFVKSLTYAGQLPVELSDLVWKVQPFDFIITTADDPASRSRLIRISTRL